MSEKLKEIEKILNYNDDLKEAMLRYRLKNMLPKPTLVALDNIMRDCGDFAYKKFLKDNLSWDECVELIVIAERNKKREGDMSDGL